MTEFECRIKVILTRSKKQIMVSAARLGVDTGREEGWRPETLNEAVAEIILLSDAPVEHGVEIYEY